MSGLNPKSWWLETDRSLKPISTFVLIYSGLRFQHKDQQISATWAPLKRLSVTTGLFVPLPKQTTNEFKEGPRSRRLPEEKKKISSSVSHGVRLLWGPNTCHKCSVLGLLTNVETFIPKLMSIIIADWPCVTFPMDFPLVCGS